MYQRIKMMEERIPMNPRPPSSSGGSRAEARLSGTLDEGSLDLLEHLISTVLQGNSSYLQALLQHEEILDVLDLQDNKGFTALHIAAERTDPTALRLLLGAGANPNVPDRFGRTALHWAVSGGKEYTMYVYVKVCMYVRHAYMRTGSYVLCIPMSLNVSILILFLDQNYNALSNGGLGFL